VNKHEQNRVIAWRMKLLRQASDMPRSVALTCRHFGLSRKTFYKWKARFKSHGEAGLCDRPRVPHSSPRTTPRAVMSKVLYLRDRYGFGPSRIASYLKRFHQLTVARSTAHRILVRHEPPASQPKASADRAALEAI
jgi:transposase